jgi:hypothetical protein
LREEVPKIVVQLTIPLCRTQIFMAQLVLHVYERIAHALGTKIPVESGGVGATEPMRRELIFNRHAGRHLLDVEQVAQSAGTEGPTIGTEKKHPVAMPDHLRTNLLHKPAQRACKSRLNPDEAAPVAFAVNDLDDSSLQIDFVSAQRC